MSEPEPKKVDFADPTKLDKVKPKKRPLEKGDKGPVRKKAKKNTKNPDFDKDKLDQTFKPEEEINDDEPEKVQVQAKPWKPFFTNYLMELITYDEGSPKYEMWPFLHYRIADFTMGSYGKRRTGKTTLLKDIVSQIKDQFRDTYIFTNTWFNGEWEGWINKKHIMKGFNEGALLKIFQNQEKIVAHNRLMYQQFNDQGEEFLSEVLINPYVLIIFDDVVSDERFHDSDVLNNIAFNGRHLGIFAWVNAQDPYKVAPSFRGNFDIAFTFRQRQDRCKDCIRGEYLDFLIKRDARTFIDHSTVDKHFIAIDTTSDEPPEDCVYIGKADLIKGKIPLPYGGKQEAG
jgi:hypothetical protein